MGAEQLGRASHRGFVILILGIAVYAVIQVLFYPSHYAADDEGCYVSMAHVFARGYLSGEALQDELNLYRFYTVDGRLVGTYDQGMGWLLAPFTWFGHRAVFVCNMLMYVLGFIAFYLLVRKIRVHPAFSLLYILYPTLWNDSRNIRSGFPSSVMFLWGVYCFLRGGRMVVAAGVLMGLAVFVRPTTALFVGGFLLVWFVRALLMKRAQRQDTTGYQDMWKRVAMLALGGVIPLTLLLAYNTLILHSPSGLTPPRLPVGYLWSPVNIPANLVHYGLSLNVVYPLMLVLFFFYRGPLRWPIFGAVVLGIGYYLMWNFWGFPSETWPPGEAPMRFLEAPFYVYGPVYSEAVSGFLLLGYAYTLNRFALRFGRRFWVPFGVGLVLVFGCDVAMTVVHQRGLDRAAYFRDQLFEHTPKGALVLMDRNTRTFISSDVTRPRKLVWVFPFPAGRDTPPEDIKKLVDQRGEAYVTDLDMGYQPKGWSKVGPHREALLQEYPHETVCEVAKDGWRLRIYRLKAGGA